MSKPWTDGPRELIQHAADHLEQGGDFDRRIAMISVDNAVELIVKVYLSLPKRARRADGPSRKQFEAASESFPDLLSLLEQHAADRLGGIGLDDIEWYHRLRNQLYHSGNGITVERAKVETYLAIASNLFENLFDEPLALSKPATQQTSVGQFMEAWIDLERQQRESERRRLDSSTELTPDFPRRSGAWEFAIVSPELAQKFDGVRRFRNELVHGLSTPDPKVIEEHTRTVQELTAGLKKLRA